MQGACLSWPWGWAQGKRELLRPHAWEKKMNSAQTVALLKQYEMADPLFDCRSHRMQTGASRCSNSMNCQVLPGQLHEKNSRETGSSPTYQRLQITHPGRRPGQHDRGTLRLGEDTLRSAKNWEESLRQEHWSCGRCNCPEEDLETITIRITHWRATPGHTGFSRNH
jgi:hypothetical protein